MRLNLLAIISFLTLSLTTVAQGYWQQNVAYKMDVDLNVNNHQITGSQSLEYTNNSPDTLNKVYYHLYFNAFQPGSMMDVRSRTISDPDRRVGDRILNLTKEEQGFQEIKSLTQNGENVSFAIEGTVLTAQLPKPIAPGESVTFDMQFLAQIPLQVRRSGRDNAEGIDFTVTQWYPKIAEYDHDGWHANEYVGREFYGVWGSFDVNITIDSNFTVAGTGVVLNPDEVGHGYSPNKADKARLTWHFVADNVHDFGWAADPDYQHDIIPVDENLQLHFFYQTDTLAEQWKEVQPAIVKVFQITNATFGRYPYTDFSVIQGGDGGMEYPMCTMVVGHGSLQGKIGLITHEGLHNWYYGVLGTNEYRYPWMDEGMTTYAEEFALDSLNDLKGKDFLKYSYDSYRALANSKNYVEEPLSTPGDLFDVNRVYSINAYSRGAITQNMLRYIVGDEVYYRAIQRYFKEWKFKHPTPNDLLRIMELESNLELDWFFEHWVNTLHHINYAVNVKAAAEESMVEITNEGNLPMPIEVQVKMKNGDVHNYYIPLSQMRGRKNTTATILKSWAWVNPDYSFTIPFKFNEIEKVVLDPNKMTADVNLHNNEFPRKPLKMEMETTKKKRKSKKQRKK
tara:strand:+ start:214380 stop:216245 length:1866 start_codon:yes stop_codon:yes gene_type:complete